MSRLETAGEGVVKAGAARCQGFACCSLGRRDQMLHSLYEQ
jgi:hypothetical protein